MADEQLILVDERNRAIGSGGKQAIHRSGLLHRAFSIFMVDQQGRILLQQRSPRKYHSGGLWANSCCGHPRPGERTISAARRRLGEELGLDDALAFGFFARYRADLDHGMHENEFVYVYFGALNSKTNEICRKLRISEATFYNWRKQYVGLGVQNCETGEALSATRAEFDFQVGTAAAVNGHSIES